MASQRTLELILKISNQASAEINKIKSELQGITISPGSFAGLKDLLEEIKKLNETAGDNKAARDGAKLAAELAKAQQEQAKASAQLAKAEAEKLRIQEQSLRNDEQQTKIATEAARVQTEQAKAALLLAKAEAERDRAQQTAANAAKKAAEENQQNTNKWASGVAGLAFGFNQVTLAVQTAISAVKPLFDTLLGGVEKFNAQVLSSQTNLASATKIFKDGVEIVDPTEKIKSTGDFIKDLLKQVERDTRSLSGVTSQEVFGITDILLRNTAQIQGQFDTTKRTFKDSLAALTKGFAAELKVAGIPFQQASQEISSIFRGDITQDSLIAKKLGLDNPTIAKLKGQGKLVETILDRLSASVAGNAIATENSLEGQLSNTQDFFEVLAREAGKPIFDPIVKGLAKFNEVLVANESGIQSFFVSITTAIGNSLGPIADTITRAFAPVGEVLQKTLGNLAENYGPSLSAFFGNLGNLIGSFANFAVNQLARGLEFIITAFDALANNKDVVTTVNLVVDAFSALAQVGAFVFDVLNKVAGAVFPVLVGLLKEVKAEIDRSSAQFGVAAAAIKGFIGGLVNEIQARLIPVIQAVVDNPAFRAIAQVLKLDLAEIDKAVGDLGKGKTGLNSLADGFKDLDKTVKDGNDAIDIRAKGAEKLGTTYEQTASKAKAALNSLNDEGTDTQRIQQAAKDLIKLTQLQVEQGQISEAEAEKRLSQVADNVKVESDIQQEAVKGLAAIRKDAAADAVRDVEDQIAETQAAIASGALSEVQGIEELTRLKREQLDLQVSDVEKAIEREIAAIAKGRGSKEKLEDLRSQKRGLESKAATNEANAERDIQNARIREIERAEQKAIAVAKEAETTRQIEVQKLVNKGLLTKQEAEQKRLQFTRSTLEAELKAEQASLAKLQSLPKAGNPQEEEARQKQIRDSRQKTADLSLQLLKNEEQQQQALVAVIRERIDRANQAVQNQFKAQNLELQRQVELQNALTAAIDQQKRLLDARGNLQKAQADLVQSQYQNQIRLIEAQKSADQKARSEKDAQFDTTRKRLEIEKKLGMQLSDGQRQAQKEAVQAQLLQTNLSDEQRQKLEEQLSLLRELDGLSDKDKEIAAQKAIDELKLKAKQAEIAATEQEFAIQQQQLTLDVQRAQLLQKQEQTKLRIAAIDAKAATAQAKADLAKARADKTTTKEQIQALELGVETAGQREAAVGEQQQTQAAAAQTENQSFAFQRDALNNQQAARRGTLQTDLAILTGNTVQRRDQQGFTSLSNQLTPAEQAKQQEQQTKGNATLVEITGPQYDGLKNAIDQVYYQLGGMTEEEKKKANEKKDNSGFTYMDSSPVTQMRSLQVKIEAEQFNELVGAMKSLTNSSNDIGGTFTVNNTISGQIDPRQAADAATRQTIAALEAALRGTK